MLWTTALFSSTDTHSLQTPCTKAAPIVRPIGHAGSQDVPAGELTAPMRAHYPYHRWIPYQGPAMLADDRPALRRPPQAQRSRGRRISPWPGAAHPGFLPMPRWPEEVSLMGAGVAS